MALFIGAILQFHRSGITPRMAAAIGVPVAICTIGAIALIDRHFERNLLVAAMQCWLMLLQAWLVRPRRNQPRLLSGHGLIFVGAMGVAVLFVWRMAMMLANGEWPSPLFVPPTVQLATYLGVFVALITNTLGFLLMHMEQANQREHELATHDALTGLLNRREMLSSLEALVAQSHRKQRPVSALMVDIDHFKRVNDTFGHVNGDVVLREVSHRLKQRLRKYDVLARFGGEEFLMLLPEKTEDEATKVAESLRQTIEATPIPLPDRTDAPRVTVSVGVHARVCSGEPDEATHMASASDAALYRAKACGRNRVEVEHA
jgi:diguanylate cyclase (GGDEF)-like protein